MRCMKGHRLIVLFVYLLLFVQLMKNHILKIENSLLKLETKLKLDTALRADIDFDVDFIRPYSKASSISAIKLAIIGQDPTIQSKKRQKGITITLDLNNKK